MQRQILAGRINSQGHRPRVNPVENTKIADSKSLPRNTLYPEHALVISLPRSRARLDSFMANNHFDGSIQVVEAVDGREIAEQPKVPSMDKGSWGCLLSHQKALVIARNNKWPCVLILEDDGKMVDGFSEKLRQAMAELPKNWDMLWLGGQDNTPAIHYSEHLKILTGSWGTYSILIRDTMYDKMISIFEEQYQSSDEYYRRQHSKHNSFRSMQDLVIHQHNIPSDRLTVMHETHAKRA